MMQSFISSRKWMAITRTLAVAVLAVTTLTVSAKAQDDFTIIALPDTQKYSDYYPEIFRSQTKWIANNRSELNIKMVVGLGDIVDNGDSIRQWENADEAIDILDSAGIPYILANGNHDYDHNKPMYRDEVSNFNKYFGYSRYRYKSWYRGAMSQSRHENFYGAFSGGGADYLVIALEFYPRQSALDWAENVIKSNPSKQIIIATHSYMFGDNTRIDQCDGNGPQSFGLKNDNDGHEMWHKVFKKYKNVKLILSGHIVDYGGAARRVDLGVNGNLVNSILSNYQGYSMGGGGYLRIIKFRPSVNKIEVKTYSPYKNSYKTDSKNQFTVPINYVSGDFSGVGTVKGRVKNYTTCGSTSYGDVIYSTGSTDTDGSGYYQVNSISGGNRKLKANKSGYAGREETALVDGNSTIPLDLFVAPSGSFYVKVKNSSGSYLSGATVAIEGGKLYYEASKSTSSTGTADFGKIPAGDYKVYVTTSGGSKKTFSVYVDTGTNGTKYLTM